MPEFKWKNLKQKWEKILKSDYTLFRVKDCTGDGDCQFRSIENLLGDNFINYRNIVADYMLNISDDEFNNYLLTYKLEYDDGTLHAQWNPYNVYTKQQFANEIRKPGFNFEGDDLTLSILSKLLHYDFIIMNDYDTTSIKISSENNHAIIVLYYIQDDQSGHYNAIGLNINDSIETIFYYNSLPQAIRNLVRISPTRTTFENNVPINLYRNNSTPSTPSSTTSSTHSRSDLNLDTSTDLDTSTHSRSDLDLNTSTDLDIDFKIDLNKSEREFKSEREREFKLKECVSGRGGWLKNELINFCTILKIPFSNNDSKGILCVKIKEYFNNKHF